MTSCILLGMEAQEVALLRPLQSHLLDGISLLLLVGAVVVHQLLLLPGSDHLNGVEVR